MALKKEFMKKTWIWKFRVRDPLKYVIFTAYVSRELLFRGGGGGSNKKLEADLPDVSRFSSASRSGHSSSAESQ